MDKYFEKISNFAKTKNRTGEVEMEEAGGTDDKRMRRYDKKEKEDLEREAAAEMDLMVAGKKYARGKQPV